MVIKKKNGLAKFYLVIGWIGLILFALLILNSIIKYIYSDSNISFINYMVLAVEATVAIRIGIFGLIMLSLGYHFYFLAEIDYSNGLILENTELLFKNKK